MSSRLLVSIGCDHNGFALKSAIAEEIKEVSFTDRGCFSCDSVDYPDIAALVAQDVEQGRARFGVLICGTGVGVSIAANRSPSIRAALCCTEETAMLAREHNDANVLCIGARSLSLAEAVAICRKFFVAEFAGGRHSLRVEKLGRGL
jgi:ribose 5-phosphate isomerase B